MHTADNFNLWRSIDRLTTDFNVDREVILNGTVAKRGCELSAFDLMIISRNLKTDCKNLIDGTLDLEVLSSQLKGETLSLPKRYTSGMFSSSTSLKNTVNQFRRFGMKEHILNKLQINQDYLNHHRPLSVMAVIDALSSVEEFITDEDLRNYSKANAKDFFLSEFGTRVQKQMKKSNIVEAIIDAVFLVEKNWNYKIISRSSTGKYLIKSEQSKVMNDITEKSIYTTHNINKMRVYFFYYFIGLCGFKDHTVKIESQSFIDNPKLTFSINL